MKLMLVLLVLLPLVSSFINIVFRREGSRRKESKAQSLSALGEREDDLRSFMESEEERKVIDDYKQTDGDSKTDAIRK